MSHARSYRLLAGALAASAVLTTACGLKPEATASLKATGGAAGTAGATGAPGTGTAPGANTPGGAVPGAPGAPGSIALGPGGTTTGGSSAGGTVSGPGTQAGGSTTTTGNVSCGTPHGGSTTGVTAGTINVGIHAPLTGTGTPFPNSSFQAGAQVFWDQPGHTVCGRKVQTDFQDDQYTPAHARQVCSSMAQRDFMVVGGGGTDQIQACATEPTIHQKNVPYLSAGVTDNGLTGLSNYFAVSLTYKQQGTLVLKNAQNQGFATPADSSVASDNISGAKAKWAIVTANTPNFAGARQGIEAALNAAHIPYKDYQVDQNGNYQGAAGQFGQQLALNGFKTIYVDAAPGYFVFMTAGFYKQPAAQADWVGPGVTYTEVTVAQYICQQSQNEINGHAWFLAPAPGLDKATADFKQAYKGSYDDIEWALWGLSNSLWNLLKDASGNLTRENFITSTEHATVPSAPYVPVDFLHNGGHFGGTGAWVQKVNCSASEPDQNTPGSWDTVGNSYLRLA
jgi:hypothetical protein